MHTHPFGLKQLTEAVQVEGSVPAQHVGDALHLLGEVDVALVAVGQKGDGPGSENRNITHTGPTRLVLPDK